MKRHRSFNWKKSKKKSVIVSDQCWICEAPALHTYFGAVSCESCKMFFKRNAEQKEVNLNKVLKCKFDGDCEVNINTRHVCSCCRLRKCFASGMQVEMIRSSRSKASKTSRREKITVNEEQKPSTVLVELNESKQFPTLNLLQTDQSTLSINQWILLSNISHCFDEYSALELGERYIREQNILPLKLRFKPASIVQHFQILLNGIQLLYKNNRDFLSQSPNDRFILLHTTIQHTGSLSTTFIYHQIGLSNHPAFYTAVGLTCHPRMISTNKRILDRLDFDMITMKLFLAIICFSTITYTFYSKTPPINLSNIKEVLRTQNTYVELTWKYLAYRYNFERTVMCFSDLIRCLFLINDALVQAQDLKWFTETIDSLVKQTQQTLNLND